MDPTGGVNPTFPVSDGTASFPDYNVLYQGANPYQIPAQPTPQTSAQSSLQTPDINALSYNTTPPVQNQYYQQQEVQSTARPDWQQQIYTDLNNQSYAAQQRAPVASQYPQISPSPSSPPSYPTSSYIQSTSQTATTTSAPTLSWPQQTEAYQLPSDGVVLLDEKASQGILPKLLIGLGVIVVLIGALVGTYFFGSKSGYKNGANDTRKEQARKLAEQAKENTQQSDTDNDEASLDFSVVEPEYKEESIEGDVGNMLQASDGLVILVKNIERNFQPTSSSYEAAPGTELVKVNILVGNASQTKSQTIKNTNFMLELLDGTTVSATEEIGSYDGKIGTLTLSPGNKARLSMVFPVKKDIKKLTLLRQQPYILQQNGQTITMSMRIKLD